MQKKKSRDSELRVQKPSWRYRDHLKQLDGFNWRNRGEISKMKKGEANSSIIQEDKLYLK
jgi:hypothetical protein